jgi:hypothetical protein
MVKSNTTPVETFFKNQSQENVVSKIIESFIQCPPNRVDKNFISENISKIPGENKVLNTIVEVMSLPEFQLI